MKTTSQISARTRVRAVPAALAAFLLPAGVAAAQEDEEAPSLALSEVPSSGGARPGPVRPSTPATPAAGADEEDADAAAEETEETEEPAAEGVAPIQFLVEKFAIDAPIEQGTIEDGVMIDPTGPWVITWYDEIAAPGEGTNVIMAGHVDYYTVGAAVLWTFKDPGIAEGDVITLTGEDGTLFEYAVEWSRNFEVATELTPEVIQNDIVGDTGEEALTVITCGGDFNQATGEYTHRQVVRATLV